MSAKILTIAQQKGGAGKTTVVAQLATTYASQKKNVALVDIDPQASLTSWFAERKRTLGENNRIVLSSVGGWRLKNELDRLKQDFDIILVDAPPHAETEANIAIRYADLLVIPVQPSPMDVWATAPTFKQAKKEKTEALNKEKVEFLQKKISLGFPIGIKEDSLTIGLHSCGDLGTSLIKELGSKKSCELLLFSCCYHKIDQGQNLSLAALKNPMHFSSNALHLASRSGKIITKIDLAKRKRFKRHRYSLHYFLFDQFKLPFRALGNTSPKDYQGPFSKYAKAHPNLASLKGVSEEELDSFYQSEETKNKFIDNFNADIIRLMLGRLIEQYIIIDRALYLKERGHRTSVEEVFDRSLSPRNILLRSYS